MIEAHDYADLPLAEVTEALAEQGITVPATALWIHVSTPAPRSAFGGLEAAPERIANMPLGSGIILVRFDPLADEEGTRVSTNPQVYRPELLDDISALSVQTSELVSGIRGPFVSDIKQLRRVAGNLDRGKAELDRALQVLPIKLNKIGRTATYGSWFNFYLCQFQGRVRLPGGQSVPVTYKTGSPRCELG